MPSTKTKRPAQDPRVALKVKPTQGKDEAPEKEAAETSDSPLLDLSDAAVRKMIKLAKKRGYVTYEQLNAVLPSEEVTSEQIEDILAMMNELGINVVEQEDAEPEEQAEESREEEEEEADGELVEVVRSTPAKAEKAEPAERTDDPVRMYLPEMGSVDFFSREGQTAIPKRIEAGREAMIAGLCESPLTFQAIIIWRDELNEGKVFLRDVIDLDATYGGPYAKALPTPEIGLDGQASANIAVPGQPGRPPQMPAPDTAPVTAIPLKQAGENTDGKEIAARGTINESHLDDDYDENENW